MMDPRKHWRALEKSYSKNLENLVKVDEFLHTCDLPKSNQETLNNLNRSITIRRLKQEQLSKEETIFFQLGCG